jgi:hypothetical protein
MPPIDACEMRRLSGSPARAPASLIDRDAMRRRGGGGDQWWGQPPTRGGGGAGGEGRVSDPPGLGLPPCSCPSSSLACMATHARPHGGGWWHWHRLIVSPARSPPQNDSHARNIRRKNKIVVCKLCSLGRFICIIKIQICARVSFGSKAWTYASVLGS